VPIVFTQAVDPVGQALVSGLALPGSNLTGFTSFELPELDEVHSTPSM
jgi:ABC-type uncharacterized transport system substrate-binding protein